MSGKLDYREAAEYVVEHDDTATAANALRAAADEIERLTEVSAAAWSYRVAYEAYWGENVPGSHLPVEQKARMLETLVLLQGELDAALDALDDDPGDFASAKAAHRATAAEAIRAAAVLADEEEPTVIDADEFEAAKKDPSWREFCERADTYLAGEEDARP